jgi:hypothetical protein
VASKPGGLNIKEWLQPRNVSHTEGASVDGVDSRPAAETGKADVLWEEMGMSTIGATGVRVQAPRGGSAEMTLGKAIFQQGLTATCKDLLE